MMKITRSGGLLAQFRVRSILRDRIKATQSRDHILVELMEKVCERKFIDFSLDDEVFYELVKGCIFLMWTT